MHRIEARFEHTILKVSEKVDMESVAFEEHCNDGAATAQRYYSLNKASGKTFAEVYDWCIRERSSNSDNISTLLYRQRKKLHDCMFMQVRAVLHWLLVWDWHFCNFDVTLTRITAESNVVMSDADAQELWETFGVRRRPTHFCIKESWRWCGQAYDLKDAEMNSLW